MLKRRTSLLLGGAGGLLGMALVWGALPAAEPKTNSPPKPPLGLLPVFWPEDDPYTAEKAELGRLLYFDKRLSADGSVACASCHDPKKAFTDGAAFSTGISGQKGGRSAPTVINRAYSTLQFWDGRAKSLEEQAKGPIANPVEMTNQKDSAAAHKYVVENLRKVPGYVARFDNAFGTRDFTIDHIAKAIATFERTIYSGNSPFDRYRDGDKMALTPEQIRGQTVFFKKAACDACHIGFNFTDGSYANIGIGVGVDGRPKDMGRWLVTGRDEERGAFKVPTLREIEHTAPYMHDGSFKTLEEVVEHYNKGGVKNMYLDQRVKPLNLTDQEKKDLVAFMKALSGEGWQHIQPPQELPK